MIITIDGPAGVGKTTLVNNLSKRLRLTPISSGNLYRAVTIAVIKHGIDCNNEKAIRVLLKKTNISIQDDLIVLNGVNVTNRLHTPEVDDVVPYVANHKTVRKYVNSIIRKMAKHNNVVLEGRDMGKVFSDADVKFVLTASVEERARRRFVADALQRRTVDLITKNIIMRDGVVKKRGRYGKLTPVKNAIVLDTTNMTSDQVLEVVTTRVNEKCRFGRSVVPSKR